MNLPYPNLLHTSKMTTIAEPDLRGHMLERIVQ